MSSVKKLFSHFSHFNHFRLYSLSVVVALSAGISGCREGEIPAPITDGWRHERAKDSLYTVQSDDTIYSIAWAFDLDYRHLAKINHISAPYRLSTGQKLQVFHGEFIPEKQATVKDHFVNHQPESVEDSGPGPDAKTEAGAMAFESSDELPITSKKPQAPVDPKPSAATQATQSTAISAKGWQWPAQGKLVQGFSLTTGALKGIDIAGKEGSSVFATRAGKVVYSGNGLRGYGKLLIIKHNDEFLSAYAHNQSLLVQEGQAVRQGQEIATMGKTGAGSVKLHFEIRRAGKPINPLIYLKATA